MKLRGLIVLLAAGVASAAAAPAYVITPNPASGRTHGDASLFEVMETGITTTWDSTKANSFFYFPLALTLTRQDTFSVAFELDLSDIAIGTTPGKPYTFQIAVGLINTTNAFDPAMFRGSGVNVAHGARNLLEWNYFPDSGFGATVAPTIATAANQIAFSDNHPLELERGQVYRFEMAFSQQDQTLRSKMRAGTNPAIVLKPLPLADGFNDFALDAIAIASYSDTGQSPPQFSGSIRARGLVSGLSVSVYNRPMVSLAAELATVSFETTVGYVYRLESTADLRIWKSKSDLIQGTGETARISVAPSGTREFFRVGRELSP